MKRLGIFVLLLIAVAMVPFARSGHELPVYPSYYPHQIQIETIAPGRAADLLLQSKIQAYIGSEPRFLNPLPDSIRAVESLGSFVIVRVNQESPLVKDNAAACAVARTVVHEIAVRGGNLIFHPYPVTPFHGDYLYHIDLADAAKARLLGNPVNAPAHQVRSLKVRAIGARAKSLVRPDWYTQNSKWDAAVEEVSVADLVSSSATAINGWLGPPWLRTGWFQAILLLPDSLNDLRMQDRLQAILRRLETSAYESALERINLERELVTRLTSSCHSMVAGYTVKREFVSTEYYAGIENIESDSIEGLNSSIFVRTVKLKDFPWNGWLALGIDTQPAAAWNPIAGFTDPFGRLMWSALSDPALIPSPNDAGWILNRISDVQSNSGR